jgi:hypothetical protein
MEKGIYSWASCDISVIPAFGRQKLRQEIPKLKTSLGYIGRSCLKQANQKLKKRGEMDVVFHSCSDNYLRGKDQEIKVLRPA